MGSSTSWKTDSQTQRSLMTSDDFGGHDPAEGLTGIHPRIHSTATPDEVIQLQTDAFLDALADVALSVAKRAMEPDGERKAA